MSKSRPDEMGVAQGDCPSNGGPDTGERPNRTPSGPQRPRRRRPKGWSPLSDWCLVRTKTGQENWARVNCRQQDIETWLPRYEIPGRGGLAPLFPGYLFVRPGNKFAKLRNTYGVIDILMRGGDPEYVPKAVMRELKKRENKEGIIVLPSQRTPTKGERVQIKTGAWQQCFGLYDGLTAGGRIKVLLEFMGRAVTLEFNRASSIEVVS